MSSLTPIKDESSVKKIPESQQNLSSTEPGHDRNLSVTENLLHARRSGVLRIQTSSTCVKRGLPATVGEGGGHFSDLRFHHREVTVNGIVIW